MEEVENKTVLQLVKELKALSKLPIKEFIEDSGLVNAYVELALKLRELGFVSAYNSFIGNGHVLPMVELNEEKIKALKESA